MRKILDLTNEALRTGRNRGPMMEGGAWESAIGLNPYLESDTYRGLMAITPAPTDKTGSVVVDIPSAYVKDERGSTYDLCMLGSAGHFYSVTAAEVVTDLRSGTPIDSPANGMMIFQPKAASSPTLLFGRTTRIGTWDLSGSYPTGWNDVAYNPGETTLHRPMHRFLDRVFYGNKYKIGQFADDGTATIEHTANVLDMEKQETVTALSDDGRYLVIATARIISDSYDGLNRVRILFWGTNTSSWDWETTIPNETSIRGMKRVGDVVYAVGKRGLYALAFGAEAQMVYSFDDDETIAFDALDYNHVQSIAAWGDGVIFGKLATAFSRFLPGTDRMVFNPLHGQTGSISLIISDFLENKVYVGTRTSKLYSFNMASAGATAADISQRTRFFKLDREYHIQRLEIDLPNGIGASDSMTIAVGGDGGSNVVTLPAITQARYGNRHFLSIPFPRQITTTNVRISVTMSAGAPSFSSMSLWGERAT
jgi:hypothetical protein